MPTQCHLHKLQQPYEEHFITQTLIRPSTFLTLHPCLWLCVFSFSHVSLSFISFLSFSNILTFYSTAVYNIFILQWSINMPPSLYFSIFVPVLQSLCLHEWCFFPFLALATGGYLFMPSSCTLLLRAGGYLEISFLFFFHFVLERNIFFKACLNWSCIFLQQLPQVFCQCQYVEYPSDTMKNSIVSLYIMIFWLITMYPYLLPFLHLIQPH